MRLLQQGSARISQAGNRAPKRLIAPARACGALSGSDSQDNLANGRSCERLMRLGRLRQREASANQHL